MQQNADAAEIHSEQAVIHGVLVEMFGIGVLLIGESGIGKSECALDLVRRGHRLVADDAVQVRALESTLEGSSPELTAELLEIRGLGIVNIRELYGISAVCGRIGISLCIELKKWSSTQNIERLGLETIEETILGRSLIKFVLPVSAGRNLSTLVETAVRVYLLKQKGIDTAQYLVDKHSAMLL